MIRQSKNKVMVKNILNSAKKPLTANEIYLLSKNSIDINLSTIYRILNHLEDTNFVVKTIRQNKTAYYEVNNKKHGHQVICSNCNNEIKIDICPIIDEFKKNIENKTGYEIKYHSLELRGICPNCKKIQK